MVTTVSLNETKVAPKLEGDVTQDIYVDSSVLSRALVGATVGGVTYEPISLGSAKLIGLGIKEQAAIMAGGQLIVSAEPAVSIPAGLYPNCVKITLKSIAGVAPVEVGDGVFYIVGGEVLLKDYIM
jgi:hypothetical protein